MRHRQSAAVEGDCLSISESDRITLLSGSLKKEADETLFLELALRGYDLSKPLRENQEQTTETAEIVKIGEIKDEIL